MKSRMGYHRAALRALAAAPLALCAVYAWAAPTVTNIAVAQRQDGSGIIDIHYDLSGGVGQITVALDISTDGGATWTVTPQTEFLAGDVGVVTNGVNKHIVWDFARDRPGVCWTQARARLAVTDETPEGEGEPPGNEMTITLPGGVPLVMVRIPAGTYMRGRYSGEQDSYSSEDPQHQVTLTQDFYLGKYTVTKGQWQAVMGTTPWSGQSYVLDDPDSPAVWVTWHDAQSFITALNAHITDTGQGAATVRLPSEAEWEYAARAGTTTRFYWGEDPDYTQIGDYAWYSGNAWDVGNRYAHVVGLKLPNPWGLYDMSGNVYEWCQDWYGTYPSGSVTDPTGPTSGSYRVLRGGSWFNRGWFCRSAYRPRDDPDLRNSNWGFRVASFSPSR